jgi:hypothetical protein
MARIKKIILSLACALLIAAFSPGMAIAQIDTGGVAGTVKDSGGLAVEDAQFVLTNNATGVSQKTQSNSTGTYFFEAVPPGVYTLEVEMPGFAKYLARNIHVFVQQTVTANIPLLAGSVSQEVNVTSADPLLQAQDAAVGQTIDTETVNDLPLNGRDWISLAQLSAGVATVSSGAPGGSTFSVDGINFWQNDVRLNGIDDNVEIFGGYLITPPPDAIQEFKLQNGDFSAQFGHSTGAVVNAIVKSGTNRVRGDVWEYLRNEALDANDYFSNHNHLARPEYRQNQFGGTLGGPVYLPKFYDGRNRTFFFASYQGTRIITPTPATETVPTLGMANSNFTNLQDLISFNSGTRTDALGRVFSLGTVLDPATTRPVAPGMTDPITGLTNTGKSVVYVRDPFYTGNLHGMTNFIGATAQLNQIPQSRIDPNAVKLLHLYPSPTGAGLINNYFINPKETENTNQYDIRVDENLSPNNIFFVAFDRSVLTMDVAPSLPGLAVGQTGGAQIYNYPVYLVAAGYTHVFTPTLTNESHIGWSHLEADITSNYGNTFGIPAEFGIQGIPQVANNGGLTPITIGGLTAIGVKRSLPTLTTITDLEFTDNVTKIYRNHAFKTGFQFDAMDANITQPQSSRGAFTYSGQYSDIPNANSGDTGIADALLLPTASTVAGGLSNLGGVSTALGSNYAATDYVRHYFGAYAQDDWKVTPTLTLNLGLRWDYFRPYSEAGGRQANLIQANGDGPTGTYYISNKGCSVPRSASFDALLARSNIQLACVPGLSLGTAQNFNFAPRLGFAYQVKPKVVVRGGYGIAYGALANLGYGGTLGGNYPFIYNIDLVGTSSQSPIALSNGATATMENTFSTINLQDPTQVSGAGVSLYGRQYNYQTPYSQTFNLTTQYQFTNRDSIQVGYVGTLGRHLDNLGSHNSPSQILPPGVSINAYTPFPGFAPNSTYETTNATSSYNSLQTTYQHDFSGGLVLLANYTYSKCMSDQRTESTGAPGYRAQWLPGFGIAGDYSLCDTDVTHVVHLSGGYALPFGRKQAFLSGVNRFEDALIGGWHLNYIYTYQSGQAFTIACPIATTSDFGCNANKVPGQNPYAGPHDQAQWLNPHAFANPPIATQIGQTDYSVLGGSPQQSRGPGFSNLDSSLFKEFATGERTALQFRVEAFNTFNTPQFGQPGNLDFTNQTNFSEITTLRNNARLLQLALKFLF